MRLIKPIGSIFAALFLICTLGLPMALAQGDPEMNQQPGAYRPQVIEGQMEAASPAQGRSVYGADVNAQDLAASQRARQAQYEQMRRNGQVNQAGGYINTASNQGGYASGGSGGQTIVNYDNDRDVQPQTTAEIIRRDLESRGGSLGGPLRADIKVVYQAHLQRSFYTISVMSPNGQRVSDQGYMTMYNQGSQLRNRVTALVGRLSAGYRNQEPAGYGNSNRGKIAGAYQQTSWNCRGDDDCDGVLNYGDYCPDTPKGVKVNKLGCPGAIIYGPCLSLTACAQAKGQPCAGQSVNPCSQPAGSPCGGNPPACGGGVSPCAQAGPCTNMANLPSCPDDDDCDTVSNCRDYCPCTPPGCPVDKCGCPIKADERWVVEFDVDKYFIRDNEKEKLNRLAKLLLAKPTAQLILSGNTDSDASDAHNMTLSNNRAKSVRSYLGARGVSVQRIRIQWFGEREPIATNATSEGKQRNRRTEILLVSR